MNQPCQRKLQISPAGQRRSDTQQLPPLSALGEQDKRHVRQEPRGAQTLANHFAKVQPSQLPVQYSGPLADEVAPHSGAGTPRQ
eukprot:CAMPEP_0194777294 /NCGR_PEP_ID=MMETSP0323_2-20130528/65307_1 /TAXON_ID=2866 ORGANISM="Crypthecodinium cohnii, Strain Seligo" /NCGR_SAMPLE_ID=MMETSP0323_2 /ASSEMBLY_ACC=CAM_ASM_000346 /LENGTH=83 /DNA_ID=CAMNT_0039714041 /DNA_START=106 /DNA_END=358 /DNA_ORIENTATION=+